MPTPRDAISVKFPREVLGLQAEIPLPVGLTGEFVWKRKPHSLRAGTQSFVLP